MGILTADELVTLCKNTKNNSCFTITVDQLVNYLEKIDQNIQLAPDAAKKEKFEQHKDICNRALKGMRAGNSARDLISQEEIDELADGVFLNYGISQGTADEKAKQILEDKKSIYRYIFSEEEIISILKETGGEGNNSVTVFPEKLIQAINTTMTKHGDSLDALEAEMNPGGKLRPEAFSSYEKFCSALQKINSINTQKRQENKPDPSGDAVLDWSTKVLPLIDAYLNGVEDRDQTWTAVSYILRFPRLTGAIKLHMELPEEQTDRWLKSIKTELKLDNLQQAKIVIKRLAPYFDMKISEAKFDDVKDEEASGSGPIPGSAGGAQPDTVFFMRLNNICNDIRQCINENVNS